MATRSIFISYRRDDSGWAASNIYSDLARQFRGRVFMDVDSIPVGTDFVVHLQEQVDRCDSVVVLIGENWASPRLRDSRDFVRIEIERALDQGKAVIPVLLDNARMPLESDIPYSINGLLNRQAVRVRRESYRFDLPHLVESLRSVAAARRTSVVRQWARNWFRPGSRGIVEATFIDRVRSDVLEQILRDPDRLRKGPTGTRTLTVMLCNVRGLSAVAERMAAQDVIAYLTDVMTPFTDAIVRRRGTLDKYLGDSLLAFWNAPLDDRTPEANACAAALELQDAVTRINGEASERGYPAVRIGVALATGPCAVGPMGTRRRFEYSCFGETVNMAGRLVEMTRTYGVMRLIDEATAGAVARQFAVLDIDSVAIRGLAQPMRVFALVGDDATLASAEFRQFAEKYNAARSAYLAEEWEGAERGFIAAAASEVAGLDTAELCRTPLHRIKVLRTSPESDRKR